MTFPAFQLVEQIFVFFIGSCLGSFFNVVIHRLPLKESLVRPGSRCPQCREAIAFYDNIPILSYLVLRGQCRRCHARISIRYPLVEALTAVMALSLFNRYGLHPQFLIEFLFAALLILIAFIDLDTYIIPNALSLTGMAAGLALSFFTPRITWTDSLLGIVVGGGFLYAIAVAYQYFRRQEGMGGGDIKLLGMIGAFMGTPGVVFTILVASIVGTVVGLAVMRRSKDGLSTMVPFGPFLSFGAVCYLFWGQQFIQWYLQDVLGS